MAPSSKRRKEVESANQANPTAEIVPGRRVTRSLTRPSDSASAPPQRRPPKKKARKTKGGEENVKSSETKDADGDADGSKKVDVVLSGSGSGSRTIIIERSTICSRFKIRAERVKEGLEKAIPGINVIINPEKQTL